jgi:hypothetical protein
LQPSQPRRSDSRSRQGFALRGDKALHHISSDSDPDSRVAATSAPASSSAPHLADPDHNTSFTKGIFLGELREDLVFPFPALGDDERESLRLVLDSFRAFAADTIDSKQMDHDGKFTDAVRAGMHELGMMGMNIPEEYGGFGASSMVFNRVFAEVGSHDPALAVYGALAGAYIVHESATCHGPDCFGEGFAWIGLIGGIPWAAGTGDAVGYSLPVERWRAVKAGR